MKDYGTVEFGKDTHVYMDDDRREQVEYKGRVRQAEGGGFIAEDSNSRAIGGVFADKTAATDAVAGH